MLIASKMINYIFFAAEQNFDNHSREKWHITVGKRKMAAAKSVTKLGASNYFLNWWHKNGN